MTQDDIRSTVHTYIRKNFLFDDGRALGDDESLLGSGVVDSTGILELISFLEDTFSVKFKDSDLVAENFDSVTKIVGFVQSRTRPS
jgi:acyl carrier protein